MSKEKARIKLHSPFFFISKELFNFFSYLLPRSFSNSTIVQGFRVLGFSELPGFRAQRPATELGRYIKRYLDLGTTNVCKITFLFADAALLNMKLPDAAVGLASATVTAAEQGLGLAHQGLEQVWLLTQFFPFPF